MAVPQLWQQRLRGKQTSGTKRRCYRRAPPRLVVIAARDVGRGRALSTTTRAGASSWMSSRAP